MSEATAIQEQPKQDVKAIYNEKFIGNFTRKELDTLRATIARGTNDEEFGLFVQTCVNTGLNPFLNHIHCMVYDGKNGRQLSIQISAEGVVYLARKAKGFKGVDAQTIHENDEFKIDLATKKIVKHEVSFPRGRVVGGYAVARHQDFEDKILLMDVAEVEHMKRGKNGHMWNTWFVDMFKKHMLKRVAKEQYGIDLTEEDVQAAPVQAVKSYEPEKPQIIQIDENTTVSEEEQRQELWDEIESNVPEDILFMVMKKHFNNKSEEELSLQELAAVRQYCRLTMNQQKNTQQEETIDAEFTEQSKQEDEISEFSGFFD